MAAKVKFPEAALAQHPGSWSGGLAQQLALARALLLQPALLVMDETFSALDPTLGGISGPCCWRSRPRAPPCSWRAMTCPRCRSSAISC